MRQLDVIFLVVLASLLALLLTVDVVDAEDIVGDNKPGTSLPGDDDDNDDDEDDPDAPEPIPCRCETCDPFDEEEQICCDENAYPQCCGEMDCVGVPRDEEADDGDDLNPFRRRRRTLREELFLVAARSSFAGIKELDATTQEWTQYKELCKDYIYDLYLYVDTHIFLVAKPSSNFNDIEKMKQDGCTYSVFHSELSNATTATTTATMMNGDSPKQVMTKKVVVVHTTSSSPSLSEEDFFWNRHQHSLLLLSHNRPFYEYSTVFDAVDMTRTTTTTTFLPFTRNTIVNNHSHNYDIIHNNCGDFAVQFCLLLGDVQFTPSITKWITQTLLEQKSLSKMIKKLTNHPDVSLLQQLTSTASEESISQIMDDSYYYSLVETLVESRTGQLY